MIKPHAVSQGHIGAIMDMINKGGFKFKAIKMLKLSREQASEFYAVHKGKPFYEDLCVFMSSGPTSSCSN